MGDATPEGPPIPSRPLSFPSKLLSKHKTLYKNHSFAVYTLALLGTTISVSLSRAPLIPLRGSAHRLFYSYRGGATRGFSGANFALTEFYEVGLNARSTPIPSPSLANPSTRRYA